MPPAAAETAPRFRVVLAKAGLDGHNRGAHVIVKGLMDAGFEVIYLGVRTTSEEIVHTALEEDVDCVGISILSGAHRTVLPRIRALLDEGGVASVPLLAGGIIPDQDIDWLKERGVEAVFGPGTSLGEICRAFGRLCALKRSADEAEREHPGLDAGAIS
jgi:methylmalonyl-CoA mutase, C-terminal domain